LDIVFIEKSGNKCIIHATSKTVYCYQSLESIYDKLENVDFIRCHKSFIVNKNFIQYTNLTDMEIILINDQKCYIGGKYKKNLMKELNM
jgi:two-component system response regulator AgrA